MKENIWDEYCDMFVKGESLLLADVFNNCQNMHLKIRELDKTISASGLKEQAALKNNKFKLDVLTDIYILSMVEKVIRDRICHTVHWYAKANKSRKIMLKVKIIFILTVGR